MTSRTGDHFFARGNARATATKTAALSPFFAGVVAAVFAAIVAAGCSAKKEESTQEGLVAAQRAAQAQAQAQADAGVPALAGPGSSMPSVTSAPGQITLQAPPAPPATAPTGDDFKNDDPNHLLARCRDRVARQEWFDAAGDCRRTLELAPTWIEPQELLMRILMSLSAYADAEKAARAVLEAKPNDPVALYYLGWSFKDRGMYPQAIDALERACAADPKRVEFVQALGRTQCLDNKFGKGIATLERALAMRPGDQKTEGALSQARALLAEKLGPWQRAVREKPDSYDDLAALGWNYQKYGLPEKALVAYDTVLARLPGPLPEQDAETKKLAATVYYNRGMVYRDLGRPADAEPAFWQAMQLQPSLAPMAWYFIGRSRTEAGKPAEAVEALKRSIDLAPDVPDNRDALAEAFDKLGKTGPAAEQRNAATAIRARQKAEKEERLRQLKAEEETVRPPSDGFAPAAAPASPSPAVKTAPVSGEPKRAPGVPVTDPALMGPPLPAAAAPAAPASSAEAAPAAAPAAVAPAAGTAPAVPASAPPAAPPVTPPAAPAAQ